MYPILAGVFGAIAADYYLIRRPMFKAYDDLNRTLEERNRKVMKDYDKRLQEQKERFDKRGYGK